MSDALAEIAERLRSTPRHVEGGTDALCDLVVVPALREAIVGNMMRPGERLTEVTLAARLKVSRTPVREAFAQLEREGL
ncbi:MAG TPA: GntR family transcriptional regulator, partial [Luteibacter sp.]|nr:GntR family transcriptional regulator [Luteibacter sp.]